MLSQISWLNENNRINEGVTSGQPRSQITINNIEYQHTNEVNVYSHKIVNEIVHLYASSILSKRPQACEELATSTKKII